MSLVSPVPIVTPQALARAAGVVPADEVPPSPDPPTREALTVAAEGSPPGGVPSPPLPTAAVAATVAILEGVPPPPVPSTSYTSAGAIPAEEVSPSPLHPTAEILTEAIARADAKLGKIPLDVESPPRTERQAPAAVRSPVPRLLSSRLVVLRGSHAEIVVCDPCFACAPCKRLRLTLAG